MKKYVSGILVIAMLLMTVSFPVSAAPGGGESYSYNVNISADNDDVHYFSDDDNTVTVTYTVRGDDVYVLSANIVYNKDHFSTAWDADNDGVIKIDKRSFEIAPNGDVIVAEYTFSAKEPDVTTDCEFGITNVAIGHDEEHVLGDPVMVGPEDIQTDWVTNVRQYYIQYYNEDGQCFEEGYQDSGERTYVPDVSTYDYMTHYWVSNGNRYTDEELEDVLVTEDAVYELEYEWLVFDVDFSQVPGKLSGNATATHAEDYTATVLDFDSNYIYAVRYKIGDGNVETVRLPDGVSTLTIEAEDIIGDIVFTEVIKTLQEFSVTFDGNSGEFLDGEETAYAGADYIAEVKDFSPGKEYTITYTIDGDEYTVTLPEGVDELVIPAGNIDGNIVFTEVIAENRTYNVDFSAVPGELIGETTATYGTDYTVEVDNFNQYYDYTIKYTIGGGTEQTVVLPNSDASFVIDGEDILGDIVFTEVVREPKSYNVDFSAVPGELIGESTATYSESYEVEIADFNRNYAYEIKFNINGGLVYTVTMGMNMSEFTIEGNMIIGDIVFLEVNKTPRTYDVDYTLVPGELSGADTATYGTDFTFAVENFDEDYIYTIEFTVGSSRYEITLDEDEWTYTLPGSRVEGDITFLSVEKELRTYDVRFNGNSDEFLTGASTVLAKADYTAEIIDFNPSKEYTITYKIGNGQEIEVTIPENENTITIPADEIHDDIEFWEVVSANRSYEVDFSAVPGELAGNDMATYESDYTVEIDNFNDNYNYTVKYTIDGGAEQTVVLPDGDSSFVIDGADITGEIVFTEVVKEPKTYDVDFSAVPGELVGESTATYEEDYTVEIDNFNDNYNYTVKYTIGGGTEQTVILPDGDASFVIDGEDITGDIEFTEVIKAPKTYNVDLTAVDGEISGNATATYESDYTATIEDFNENFIYTVKYTIDGGTEQTVTLGLGEDTLTIDGENIVGDIVFTEVSRTPAMDVLTVADYVTGYTLVVVVDGPAAGYTFDGETMFRIQRYEGMTSEEATLAGYEELQGATKVLATLIEGAVTYDEAMEKIASTDVTAEMLAESLDLDGSTVVDHEDAMTAFKCYVKALDISSTLRTYLNADVDKSLVVDTDDFNTIVADYTSVP